MKQLVERFIDFESLREAFSIRDPRAIGETIKAAFYAASFYLVVNSLAVYSSGILIYMTALMFFVFFVAYDRAISMFVIIVALALYMYRVELLLFYVPVFFFRDYLEKRKGFFFIFLVLALMGSRLSLEIAPILLAVFFLGQYGAIVAGTSVFYLQILGILLGKPTAGIIYGVTTKPLLPQQASLAFDQFLSFSAHWDHFAKFEFSYISSFVSIFTNNIFLLIQPIIWALIVMVGSHLLKRTYKGVAISYFIMTIAFLVTQHFFGSVAAEPLIYGELLSSGGWSLLIAVGLTYPILFTKFDLFGMRASGEIETRTPQAVLVVDIIGSTRLGEIYGDELTLKIKDRLDKIVRNAIQKYKYFFIKGTGDGYLITFPDANRACKASLEIMKKNQELKTRIDKREQIDLKMGLTFGEVIHKKGDIQPDDRRKETRDIHGGVVNLAFRIQAANQTNLIDISGADTEMPDKNCLLANESVIEDLNYKLFKVDFLGYFEAKGILGRHKLFTISEKTDEEELIKIPADELIGKSKTAKPKTTKPKSKKPVAKQV